MGIFFLKKVLSLVFYTFSYVLLYLILIPSICKSQRIVLKENFSDNQRKWEVGKDDHEFSTVKDGEFKIASYDKDKWHWFFINTDLQSNKEWILNVDVHIDSIKGNNAFCGIIWGAKDAQNMLQWLYYPIYKSTKGVILQKNQLEDLFPFNFPSLNDSLNIHFKILHSDSSYWFLLNDIIIDKTEEDIFLGNGIGFILGGRIQVSADNLEIKELEKNSSIIQDNKNAFSKLLNNNSEIERKWDYYYNKANQILGRGDTLKSLLTIDKADSSIKNEFYTKDTLEYWRHRNPIASFLIDAGEYLKAEEILKKCISVFDLADSINTTMYPTLLSNLGLCNSRMGNYSVAIQHYKDALEIRKKILGWKNERTIKSAEDIIAVNLKTGETGYSNKIYKEMLIGVASELGDTSEVYISKAEDYATYLLSIGNFSESLKWYQTELNNKLRGNHDLPSQLILPVYFIGKVYLQMNNLDSSKYYFNEANNLAKRANDKHSLVMTSVALAEIYRLNNENSKAINILKKNFTENSNGDDTLYFNNNIGSIYYGLGNYKKALKYFINCLRYTDKYFDYYLLQERHLLIVLYSHISEAYFKTGDYISSYQYSILTQKLIYIELNGNKGILSESDYYSFFNLYRDKIDRFNQLSILLYNNIGTESHIMPFRDVFRFNEIYRYPTSSKSSDYLLKNLLFSDDSLSQYIKKLNQMLLRQSAIYIRIVSFPLYETGNGFFAIIIDGTTNFPIVEKIDLTTTLETIFAKQISAKQALTVSENLSYQSFWSKMEPHFRGKKKIYFALGGILNKYNIESMVFVDSVNKRHYLGDLYNIEIMNSSYDIFNKHEVTDTTKNITLFGYPDYTLNVNEQTRLAKQIGVDTSTLSYMRGNNVVTSYYKFNSLPATKDEVEEIGELLQKKGWEAQIYTGSRALEEQLKKVKSPRILHIATHGFFAEDINLETQKTFMGTDSKTVLDNPMLRSGLAFAGAERTRTDTTHEQLQGIDDGIFTAEEAQFLNLENTELVVLSACETGLGTIVNGEGVYGLQRAFRAAGAKSILMSLWNVNDNATKELMKSFYHHWLDEGMNKHDALWQAKLDLRNNASHPEWALPYYWGAFVLIGE